MTELVDRLAVWKLHPAVVTRTGSASTLPSEAYRLVDEDRRQGRAAARVGMVYVFSA
jgi:hypothetical protein